MLRTVSYVGRLHDSTAKKQTISPWVDTAINATFWLRGALDGFL